MNKIQKLIALQDWSFLISHYSVKEICLSLNFAQAMNLLKHLFYDDFHDDEKQQYALQLAYEIKDFFNKDWENDWKNDVLLGDLCETLWLYNERYFFYKKAYDKLKDPPEELLLLLSNCNSAPGKPPITDEESEFYLKKALKKRLTSEVAFTLKGFYRLKNDKDQEAYWDQMYKKLEKENIHSNQIIPDVFRKN